MCARQRAVKRALAKFRVGQHTRISKEKFNIAKVGEHIYTTEVFRILKVVQMTPRPVYELEDFLRRQIDGQFYTEEFRPVRITKRTSYNIDKIL
jgi:hypothetical protein